MSNQITKNDVQIQAMALLSNLGLNNHTARVSLGSSLNGYSTRITVKDMETENTFPISQWIGNIHLGFTKREAFNTLYHINNGMWIQQRLTRQEDRTCGIHVK